MTKPELGSLDELVARIDRQVAASAAPEVGVVSREGEEKAAAPRLRHVVFSVAGRPCAVPIGALLEIGQVPPLTRIPGVPPWVAGVANLRGEVLAVFDLPGLLGFEPLERPALSSMLVARDGSSEGKAGFLVEGLHGALSVPEDSIDGGSAPLDPRFAAVARGFVEREGEPVALVDLEAVFRLEALRDLRAE